MKEKKTILVERMVMSGVMSVSRRVGCSREHLSKVLHGHRKANDDLRRRLKRLGVTHDVNGTAI